MPISNLRRLLRRGVRAQSPSRQLAVIRSLDRLDVCHRRAYCGRQLRCSFLAQVFDGRSGFQRELPVVDVLYMPGSSQFQFNFKSLI
jgi:hypothetical protein